MKTTEAVDNCYKISDHRINKLMDRKDQYYWILRNRIFRWSKRHKRIVRHKDILNHLIWKRTFKLLGDKCPEGSYWFRVYIHRDHMKRHKNEFFIVARSNTEIK